MARRTGNRMAKAWQGSFNTAVVNLSVTQANVLQSVASAGLNQTLLRTRGNILIAVILDAANDVGVAAFGLIVVQDAAANAGGVSLPGLLNDIDADWLWHTFVPLDVVILTGADANARSVVHRIEIDAKAMRRVPGDSVVVLMGELGNAGFASTAVLAGCRFLLGHG